MRRGKPHTGAVAATAPELLVKVADHALEATRSTLPALARTEAGLAGLAGLRQQ